MPFAFFAALKTLFKGSGNVWVATQMDIVELAHDEPPLTLEEIVRVKRGHYNQFEHVAGAAKNETEGGCRRRCSI